MKRYFKIILTIIFTFIIMMPNVIALEENFITNAGDNVTQKEDVNGSVALAGNNIKFNKTIKGILFGAGNNIKIDGTTDYLVVAGNNIDISGNILNDAVIAGNTISINSEAVINRDVIIAANEVYISGTINRNIQIFATDVELEDATILGNIEISAEEINIEDETTISNTLTYNKDAEIEIDNKDSIGEIKRTNAIKLESPTILTILKERLLSFLRSSVVLFVLILIVPKLFKKITKQQKEMSIKKVLLTLGKGLLTLVLIPIAILLLLISNLGTPLALITTLIYGIIIYLSFILSGYYIGLFIWNKWINKKSNDFIIGIIGLFIIYILKLIPYISIIINMGLLLLGFGIIIELLRHKKNYQ